jgi:hypothetical protein
MRRKVCRFPPASRSNFVESITFMMLGRPDLNHRDPTTIGTVSVARRGSGSFAAAGTAVLATAGTAVLATAGAGILTAAGAAVLTATGARLLTSGWRAPGVGNDKDVTMRTGKRCTLTQAVIERRE